MFAVYEHDDAYDEKERFRKDASFIGKHAFRFMGYDATGKPLWQLMGSDGQCYPSQLGPGLLLTPVLLSSIVPENREACARALADWQAKNVYPCFRLPSDHNRQHPLLLRQGEWMVYGRYHDEEKETQHFFSHEEYLYLRTHCAVIEEVVTNPP